jgi:hypothetical protein
MSCVRRQTLRLPDDIVVTILRLPGPVTTEILRAMLAAEWYLLVGATTSATGQPTGTGVYVGTSDALKARTTRVGVSLRNWTFRLGRLTPHTVVLVRRATRPVDEPPRLLVEAALARAISAAGYTVLNLRTAAPTAARRATRRQRLWAIEITDRLAGLIHGHVLAAHTPAAAGGSTREQLVRLILTHGTAMDVDQILTAAHHAGIPIPGKHPRQRTRRDCTTRELDSGGRPRLRRTWMNGRTVIYPANLTLRQARASYLTARPPGIVPAPLVSAALARR